MKKFLISFIIPILTFAVGVFIYRHSTPKVSLETISAQTWFYDGMKVEIETYAQLDSFEEDSWSIGEPFEKYEARTFLNLDDNKSGLENLRSQLKENLTENHYKRAKVLVKGTVQDNCSLRGVATCCFGKTMTIKVREIKQIAPAEDYKRPE